MKIQNFIFLAVLFFSFSIAGSNLGPIFDITDFGAVSDGQTLNTRAIQYAIDSCAKSGGKVYFPAGVFLTGSLHLKSNVTVEISEGAVLLGSTNLDDYKEHIPGIKSYNDIFLKYSLIYAEKAENISLTGRGIIDGQGGKFKRLSEKKPDLYKNRPFIIRFINCKNVLVENLQLQNSAMWMQHYFACDGVVILGIKVYNHCNKNNDMIDIDGSKNVIITDCIGDTDDDAMTIKSTSERISENITISNCVLSSHTNAIKMGTESHGGFRNINISNCIIKPSAHPSNIYGKPDGISGITLAIVDGGILDGVCISDILMDGPQVPIYLRLGNRARKYKEDMKTPPVGSFKNVFISDIFASSADTLGCSITGLPGHPIKNIHLNNITINYKNGASQNVAIDAVKEKPNRYPSANMFDKLPAYGFFIRHAENVSMNNINLRSDIPDIRPVLVADDVKDFQISELNAETALATTDYIHLNNCADVWIKASKPYNKVNTFLFVSGNNNKGITLNGNFLRNVKDIVKTEIDAIRDEVIVH